MSRMKTLVSTAVGSLLILNAGPMPAFAASFKVTNTDDSGVGSLRQAILEANASAGDDIIDFLLGGGPQTINLTSGTLSITDNLNINGLETAPVSIFGDNFNFGIFEIAQDVTAKFTWLTISVGEFGIRNNGTLDLDDVLVSENLYGGIGNSGTLRLNNSAVSNNLNGGIGNSGTAILNKTTVSNNRFGGIDNANSGTLKVTNSTIDNNGKLAGITNRGTATVTNTTFTNDPGNIFGQAGSIDNSGTITVTSSTLNSSSIAFPGPNLTNSGTVNIGNTIVNSGDPNQAGPSVSNTGTINDQGFNLIANGDGSPFEGKNGVNGNIVGTTANPVDPKLDEGIFPFADSPAVDAANPDPNSFPPTDKFGNPRPQGPRADIGAIELPQSNPQPIPTPALLPGLIGMGIAALRKRRSQQVESET